MRQLSLDREPLQWSGVDFEGTSVLLTWVAPTSIANINYFRFLSVGLCWPPVRCISGFMDDDDDED